MNDLGIWSIQADQPVRLKRSQVSLERHLEEWIERDPSLVQAGLIILGRQQRCDGGIIDLLALDRITNEWVIIEVKRGNIRRETIMQAIDYAASVSTMSESQLRENVEAYLRLHRMDLQALVDDGTIDESVFNAERQIRVCVVGTGRDAQLERMIDYLVNQYGMPITVIDFNTFEDETGNHYLMRKLTDQDEVRPGYRQGSESEQCDESELQRLFQLADNNGIGDQFRLLYDTCVQYRLYPRLYKWSIMYAPPRHRGRCLVVAWVKPKSNKMRTFAVPATFAEFYPLAENDVARILGNYEERLLTLEDTRAFVRSLDALFELINSEQEE